MYGGIPTPGCRWKFLSYHQLPNKHAEAYINYKCLANNSGFLLALAFKLTHLSYLHSATWLGTFSQYCTPNLLLSAGNFSDSALLHLNILSLLVPPILPAWLPAS